MSDENTFDFALYLGTTTPLTITGATASTVSELSERLKSGTSFIQTVRFPDMSIHAITINPKAVPWCRSTLATSCFPCRSSNAAGSSSVAMTPRLTIAACSDVNA
mgnify:CR=1 FL=1